MFATRRRAAATCSPRVKRWTRLIGRAVVWTPEDRLMPPEHGRRLADLLPQGARGEGTPPEFVHLDSPGSTCGARGAHARVPARSARVGEVERPAGRGEQPGGGPELGLGGGWGGGLPVASDAPSLIARTAPVAPACKEKPNTKTKIPGITKAGVPSIRIPRRPSR